MAISNEPIISIIRKHKNLLTPDEARRAYQASQEGRKPGVGDVSYFSHTRDADEAHREGRR